MTKDRSLRAALDRFQGKDLKLERQKKLQKDASKKRKDRKAEFGEDEESDETGGVALNLVQSTNMLVGEESGSSDDEQERPVYDLSRLDDSDWESESGEDDNDLTNGKHSGVEEASEEDDDAASIALSDISVASEGGDLVPHQRLTINNTTALTKSLAAISLPYSSLAFSDHQSVTNPTPTAIPDINDDLNRELAFYAQALDAAKTGRKLLKKEGTPFTRPVDYFAEMVKTDEHMGRVKAKLVDDAAAKKASSEARKQRDLKKFGKAVQQEKLKERAKEKRDMLDKVKILKRKRQSEGVEADREGELFDVALEDAVEGRQRVGERKGPRNGAGERPAKGTKRVRKNEKFGFGGKKKYSKSTDATSTGDMSGFSSKGMKGKIGLSKKGASKRLGKARRAKQ